MLVKEAIIVRDGRRGRISSVDWETLVRRWAMDYDFAKANSLTTYLEPRGPSVLFDQISEADFRYAVTGSFAAVRLVPVAEPRSVTLYADDPEDAVDRLGLRPAETGGNVVIARPFNPVVFERTESADGITYARATQVLPDLMTAPGRRPAEAEGLQEWMRENEKTWKLQLNQRTISAREGLLDAVEALGAHGEAVILVGAQAIYVHTEGAGAGFAASPFTYDADIALDPALLGSGPTII